MGLDSSINDGRCDYQVLVRKWDCQDASAEGCGAATWPASVSNMTTGKGVQHAAVKIMLDVISFIQVAEPTRYNLVLVAAGRAPAIADGFEH